MNSATRPLHATTVAPAARTYLADLRRALENVNKELWLILSLVVIAALLNSMVTSQRMLLGFYSLPTIASAYLYGRRHATLTAFASVLLVGYMRLQNPDLFGGSGSGLILGEDWLEVSS